MTRVAHDSALCAAPSPASGDDVRFSRSEIEAMAVKAARGAGFDWGMAEEAGLAARCLVEAVLPGPNLLLACLEAPRGSFPEITGTNWHAPLNGVLCPFATGVALSDRAAMPDGPSVIDITIRRLGHPALVLPFVVQVAARCGQTFRVTWSGVDVIAMPAGLLLELTATLTTPEASKVTISLATDAPPAKRPAQTGCYVAPEVWRRLDALALATTVPATSSSRAGAGSGSSDND